MGCELCLRFECSETVDMMSYIEVKPGWLVVIMKCGDWNEKIEGTFNEIAQVGPLCFCTNKNYLLQMVNFS